MDNKYIDIEKFINDQSKSFKSFLKTFLLDEESWNILNRIALHTDVYIFSGVIRNFFLGYLETRDLDIVVKNIEQVRLPSQYLKKITIKRNSFGGYKINLGHINIDAWGIENTWGIIQEKKDSNVYELVRTAFFNFSAIAFDYRESVFVYTHDFCEFIKTGVIDIVYEKNPNIALCILNSMYYSQKYNLKISIRLCKWIIEHYTDDLNLRKVQLKHFNKIMYDTEHINKFILYCFYKAI